MGLGRLTLGGILQAVPRFQLGDHMLGAAERRGAWPAIQHTGYALTSDMCRSPEPSGPRTGRMKVVCAGPGRGDYRSGAGA